MRPWQIARDQLVADRVVSAKQRLETVASLVKLQTLQVNSACLQLCFLAREIPFPS
jgi:hypothetical protein